MHVPQGLKSVLENSISKPSPAGTAELRLVRIRFSVGQLAHEAFTDLQRLGKTVERRARVQPCRKQPVRLTASAAEVRFSRHMGQVISLRSCVRRRRLQRRTSGAKALSSE